MNYRFVATEVGDALKYETSVNQIDRLARSLFNFQREDFPHEAITSVRAQTVYDWILSLAKQEMDPKRRDELLLQFCRALTSESSRPAVERILRNAGGGAGLDREATRALFAREMHPEVLRHARQLFEQGNYFHAVFEASKAYNTAVKDKSRTGRDGQALMLQVWGCDSGVLKITPCQTETDRNIQDGVKFLSAGLMQAIRNPTAHEPAVDWPISRQDCLDILSLVSFLFRQLDSAVYVHG